MMQLELITSPVFGDARLPPRFWAKVEVQPNGCWFWMGGRFDNGYGSFQIGGRSVSSHRWAFQQLIGPFPSGLESDHLCRARACVNPAHIEPVTHSENVLRCDHHQRRKTHCPKGHPYDERNTHMRPSGGRRCRACSRIERREYREKRRLASGHSAARSEFKVDSVATGKEK